MSPHFADCCKDHNRLFCPARNPIYRVMMKTHRISLARKMAGFAPLIGALLIGGLLSGCASDQQDAAARAPGVSVVLTEALDTTVTEGRTTARAIRSFKLTGRSDFIVPADSTIRGRYGISASDQPDAVTLWIDWINFDDLGPGASRNLGRHPAFFTLETLTTSDVPETGILPAGTVVTLRYDALRDETDSSERSSHLVTE